MRNGNPTHKSVTNLPMAKFAEEDGNFICLVNSSSDGFRPLHASPPAGYANLNDNTILINTTRTEDKHKHRNISKSTGNYSANPLLD